MKTKTKSTAKNRTRKYGKTHSSPPVRKRIEDRDLNEDDQNRIPNAVDENENDDRFQTLPPDHEVEAEEEREKKRRVEEARGEEEN